MLAKVFTVFANRTYEVPMSVAQPIAKLTLRGKSKGEAGEHYMHPSLHDHLVEKFDRDPIVAAKGIMRFVYRRRIFAFTTLLICVGCFISVILNLNTNTNVEISFERIVIPTFIPLLLLLMIATWLWNNMLDDSREDEKTHNLVRNFDRWLAETSFRLGLSREQLLASSTVDLTRRLRVRLIVLADEAIRTGTKADSEQFRTMFMFFKDDFDLPWSTPKKLFCERQTVRTNTMNRRNRR